MSHPAYNDFPKDALVKRVETLLAEAEKEGRKVNVFFKASCPQCGARPMFSEPNTVYETMECCDCGHVFPFVEGNYMVMEEMR